MRTKERDTLYCNVDQNKILNAEPTLDWNSVYHLRTFIIDRYNIHKRKDINEFPYPWTKNLILREYKFTNVRREHDRQTRYLLENITNNPDLTLEDKIVNSILFRCWNNWSTLRDFGFPYKAEEIYSPELKEQIRSIYSNLSQENPKRLWFSNAYRHGGTICAWKFSEADREKRPFAFGDDIKLGDDKYPDWEREMPLRPFHVGVWLGPTRQNIVQRLLQSKNQLEAFNILHSIYGMGEFVAYQVFVDLTYIPEFPFSENEFTVAGPGCKKGLDYIFKDRDGMTYEECIFWLRDMINQEGYSLFRCDEIFEEEQEKHLLHKKYEPTSLFSDLPEEDRKMNVMSLENCMCELSKYMRVVRGEGRPRNTYVPNRPERR